MILSKLTDSPNTTTQHIPKKSLLSPISWGNLGTLKRQLLSISLEEATVIRRGFQVDNPEKRERIEQIGTTFLAGYHGAIAAESLEKLVIELNAIDAEYRGFSHEGAAMGLTLSDFFTPWQGNRLQQFLRGAGDAYLYLAYVGMGWALARLPGGISRYLRTLNRADNSKPQFSLLGWLAIDGYGFHQGYFYWREQVEKQIIPKNLSGYAVRAFDQGLGRSLCFVLGLDVKRIAATIQLFSEARRSHLWSGVGLAAAYAGGLSRSEMMELGELSQTYLPDLAQGIAFAAKARLRAGYLPEHTEQICQLVWQQSSVVVAAMTDEALVNLPFDENTPAYEFWRSRIKNKFKV
jgi:enediyne biosynthesis protein E3